jgi:ATP-dependent protease ClpP protease subunit
MDVMNISEIPIFVYGMGVVASAALFILMNAKEGNRYVFPSVTLMSHQWSGQFEGKEHEVQGWQDYNNKITKIINDLYRSKLKIKDNFIKKKLLGPSDYYLGAEEGIRLGFADKIVTKLEF